MVSFPQVSPPKPCIRLFSPPIRATFPVHLILLELITRTILREQNRSLSCSLCRWLSFYRRNVASFLMDILYLVLTDWWHVVRYSIDGYNKCWWWPPRSCDSPVCHLKVFYVRDFPAAVTVLYPSCARKQRLFAHPVVVPASFSRIQQNSSTLLAAAFVWTVAIRKYAYNWKGERATLRIFKVWDSVSWHWSFNHQYGGLGTLPRTFSVVLVRQANVRSYRWPNYLKCCYVAHDDTK